MPGVWSWLCPSDNVHLQRNSTYTQYGYMYSSQVGELRLVIKADKTITVEVDGLMGDSLVPTNRMSSLSKLSPSIQGEC